MNCGKVNQIGLQAVCSSLTLGFPDDLLTEPLTGFTVPQQSDHRPENWEA